MWNTGIYHHRLLCISMLAAKQNQKFPFHFLSAPPTPPAEEKKKGKENFWFLLPRPDGADEARRLVLARIVLVKSSDFVQETQPNCMNWICCLGTTPVCLKFSEDLPVIIERNRNRSLREIVIPKSIRLSYFCPMRSNAGYLAFIQFLCYPWHILINLHIWAAIVQNGLEKNRKPNDPKDARPRDSYYS